MQPHPVMHPVAPMAGGVSFAPGGKSGTGGAGYTSSIQQQQHHQQQQQLQHPGGGAAVGLHGSMESLESTNSSSNFSYTSTVSTGEEDDLTRRWHLICFCTHWKSFCPQLCQQKLIHRRNQTLSTCIRLRRGAPLPKQ
jgi:hypothetical protein